MIGPLLTRVVVLGFGAIQGLLTLRLILPLIDVPSALVEWIPALVNITDLLIAPFKGFTGMLGMDLGSLGGGPFGVGLPGQLDSAVMVALIGWSIVELVIIMVLRVVTRPGA